eukprot:988396-Rhodomonas_salina.5
MKCCWRCAALREVRVRGQRKALHWMVSREQPSTPLFWEKYHNKRSDSTPPLALLLRQSVALQCLTSS